MLKAALAEVEGQIHNLIMVREGLMRAGIRVEVAGEATATTPAPTYRKKQKRARGPAGSGPTSFVRALMAESRVPLDTKTVTARAIEKGWVPNPKVAATPEAMVYQALSTLTRDGEIQRVGTEWSRV